MRGDGVRVLIVGAGITGVAAARTLRGWGAAVERAAAPMTEGTGIYLPGNAARALTGLGLGRQVAEFAVHIERQRVADHRGRRLFDVETADIWNGVSPCLALHRAQLHQVLLAGVPDVLAFVAVQQGVFGLYLGCSFAPNHKGMPLLSRDDELDYLRRQVLTSRNIRAPSSTSSSVG